MHIAVGDSTDTSIRPSLTVNLLPDYTWGENWAHPVCYLPAQVMHPDKTYYLLSKGPQLAHVGVFNRDGKSLA
jgi:hypothetical protein